MKTAIYPGSFDPITLGHIDIIERASRLFDTIIILVIQNKAKTPFFEVNERIALIQDLFKDNPKIKVEGFQGLLAEYAKLTNIHTIIRGLRALTDFDFEFQMALINRRLNTNIDTVFFMTDEKYSYLSSSAVREIGKHKGPLKDFVTPNVLNAVQAKITQQEPH
jgi:pantetheine-phosphate adenylyltransferase